MRHLRLVLPALAFVVAGTWAVQATACDKAKTTNASTAASKSAMCTPEMAAACTPEMAAACMAAKGAKGAKSAAFTAHASCASKGAKTTAVNASMSSGSCASKTTATTAAAYDHCATAKTSKISAVTASASGARNAKVSAVAVGAGSSCGTSKTKTSASADGSACTGHGMANVAAKAGHGDCDACSDMALCYEELESVNARTQMVPLKNGVMFVYTAEKPGNVNAVQSAMSRRNERMTQIVSAGDKASLCTECKTLRGAMASGKMNREVVNIEGGALTLMTSNDPAVVAKIHALVESHKNGRSKI